MLSFAFRQEQEDFRVQLRRFAVAELAPHYIERAARPEFCWEAHRQLANLGVLGIGLPEKHGGTGAPDRVTLGLATAAGTPEQVAEKLVPFVEAGAEHLTIVTVADSVHDGIDLAAEVRRLLQAEFAAVG